jgi:hypothetical protein
VLVATATIACLDSTARSKETLVPNRNCDLDHPRAARAVVTLQIKSTRTGKPGHPMVRVVSVCARHARQLRDLGIELVES